MRGRSERCRATTPDAAKRAEDALTLNYIDRLGRAGPNFSERLKRVGSYFFNPDLYSVVQCDTKSIEGLTFVGCKLTAVLRKTQPDIYAVAMSEEGEPVVFALGGDAKQRSEGIRALHDMKNRPIRFGLYTGPIQDIDYPKVRAEFK